MRKYIEIAKIYLKAQLFWRADAVFNMLVTVCKILFAYLLWGVIFEGRETVSGFTYHSMLSYYIISSFLTQLEMSGGISGEINTRIRNGTFSKYMVIPVSVEKYFIAMEAGTVTFYAGFNLLAAVCWIAVFRIRFVFTGNPWMFAAAAAMTALGLLFMVQLNYFLGLLTMKFEEISTFLMIKDNLAQLITGAMIPLTLLPEGILSVMRLFPFYYVTYLPSMLLIGRNGGEAAGGLAIMAGWCILMEVINRKTYRNYRLKYDGVGI